MEDFKSNKKRDLGMEMRFFVVRFLICTRGVYSEIKVCFFVFFINGGFWDKFAN